MIMSSNKAQMMTLAILIYLSVQVWCLFWRFVHLNSVIIIVSLPHFCPCTIQNTNEKKIFTFSLAISTIVSTVVLSKVIAFNVKHVYVMCIFNQDKNILTS
jgi:hypothetical protein